jgi:two-component system response regulator
MQVESKSDRPLEILLVGDSPGSVSLVAEAIQESEVASHTSVLQDGIEALAYLRNCRRFGVMPACDLIVLNLSQPGSCAADVLIEIKQHPMLRIIPTVLLAATDRGPELVQVCAPHFDFSMSELMDVEEYAQIVESLALWLVLDYASVDGPWKGQRGWRQLLH